MGKIWRHFSSPSPEAASQAVRDPQLKRDTTPTSRAFSLLLKNTLLV